MPTLVTKIKPRRLKILIKTKVNQQKCYKGSREEYRWRYFKILVLGSPSKQIPTLIPQRKILTELAYLKIEKLCLMKDIAYKVKRKKPNWQVVFSMYVTISTYYKELSPFSKRDSSMENVQRIWTGHSQKYKNG